ncbi:MAG: hypothetical protein AAF850_08285 [Pseudomonadota bacterium]
MAATAILALTPANAGWASLSPSEKRLVDLIAADVFRDGCRCTQAFGSLSENAKAPYRARALQIFGANTTASGQRRAPATPYGSRNI